MLDNCLSDQKNYSDSRAEILSGNYHCLHNIGINSVSISNPPPLDIYIAKVNDGYEIQMGLSVLIQFKFITDKDNIIVDVRNDISGLGLWNPRPDQIEPQFGNIPISTIAQIRLEGIINIFKDNNVLYVQGDTYNVGLDGMDGNTFVISRFIRNLNSKIISKTISNSNIDQIAVSNNNTIIEIPILNIFGQTLIDGSDVGNIIFTINDKFTYYCKQILKNTKCDTYFTNLDNLKETVFEKSCPLMVTVFKGNECDLIRKVASIYDPLKNGPIFLDFYKNVLFYGMLKYILSRILYGNFNINYLLRKYNEKFLYDLQNSRFCNFILYFTDPTSSIFGFNKYFKYRIK
jgi:hypothetical protein